MQEMCRYIIEVSRAVEFMLNMNDGIKTMHGLLHGRRSGLERGYRVTRPMNKVQLKLIATFCGA